jgi:hypothetical protein
MRRKMMTMRRKGRRRSWWWLKKRIRSRRRMRRPTRIPSRQRIEIFRCMRHRAGLVRHVPCAAVRR